MTDNDLLAAKQECWNAMCAEILRPEMPIEMLSRREAFDFAFDYAYKLGMKQLENRLANERLQVAAMALPGIITMNGTSANQYQRAAQMAMNYADALLHEAEPNIDDN